jgi:hypothetical protein
MARHFRDNVAFLAVSFMCFLGEPVILPASAQEYDFINFTAPLSVSRGTLTPASSSAARLSPTDICSFTQNEWGWDAAGCQQVEAFVVAPIPGIDTALIERPNSDGYVEYGDWVEESPEAIDEIFQSFSESIREQSQRSGLAISVTGWHVRPRLVEEKNYLYYALMTSWDGAPTLNVKATLFDRYGHIPISIVPIDVNISPSELESLIDRFLASYVPTPTQDRAAFTNGDAVAAGGAVGVLATLVGVKYGKTAIAAFVAIALVALKKGGFLLLALPIWLFGRFFRRRNAS